MFIALGAFALMWAAALASAQTEVCWWAVLPGCNGTKYQALGAIPQPSARAAARHPRL